MAKISVELTNRWAYFPDIDEDSFEALEKYWSFDSPGARFSRAFKLWLDAKARAVIDGTSDDELPGWDGKIKFFKKGAVPAGLFRATRLDIKEKLGIRFQVTRDLPVCPAVKPIEEVTGKYSYQSRCIGAMVGALRRGGGIVLSATGSGKTKITGDFCKLLDVPCLFVVDLVNLLYQSQTELSKWICEPVGIVGDSKYDIQRVTVATIQTLSKHLKDKTFLKWFKTIKVVVVDELHEQMSRRNFKVLDKIQPVARYGLTATLQLSRKPVRMKAWAFAGPVLYEFPYTEGRKRKVLASGRVLQLLFPEIQGFEDYHESYVEEVVDNQLKLRAGVAVVKTLISAGRSVVVLVSRRDHVKALHEAFQGVPHRLAFGGISRVDREIAKDKFEVGKIKLIIASVVFKKGVDIRRIDAILDMAEMKSVNDVQQKFGRGVRLHKDKKDLLYIDFGTDSGRFLTSARRRLRALRANGVPCKWIKIKAVEQAIKAVKKCLES